MILQLNPTIPLDTPKGPADAFFLYDYSEQHKTMFGCFVRATGEFWIVPRDQVKLQKNITAGVRCCEDFSFAAISQRMGERFPDLVVKDCPKCGVPLAGKAYCVNAICGWRMENTNAREDRP
jgi:hypothetical protein